MAKKKSSILRNFLVTFAALAVVATLAYAGLLSYYGKVVGNVTVQQSVRLVHSGNELVCQDSNGSGCTITAYQYATIVAGESDYAGPFELRNYANKNASIQIVATVKNGPEGTNGVSVSVVGVNESSGNCDDSVNAPTSVPAASGSNPGKAYFCVKITSQLNAIAGNYEIETVVNVGQ